MRLQLAAIALLCALAAGTQVAAQEPPVGEFHVVPPSGPMGAVVTVSGDFDRDITLVSFWCLYRETFHEGFNYAHTPAEPSPSFTFEYVIPAELSLRQPRPNDVQVRAPLGGECYFRADASHKHKSVRVPFKVTEAASLPAAGLASSSHGATGPPMAVVILAVGGFVLVLLAWRTRAAV